MLIEYVEKIMRGGITNFAKQEDKTPYESQLLITWDDANQKPLYKSLIQNSTSRPVTFNQILNVKFDMLNREAIVGQFITGVLDRYSKQMDCMMSQCFVLIFLEQTSEEDDELKLYLYKGKEKIRELELEQLLM
jgi:hypothetical protein